MKRNTGIYMAPGSSARRTQRYPASPIERFSNEWKAHAIILLLAVFIWWTLKQGIETTISIEDRSRLEVVLDPEDEELQSRFSVLSQPSLVPVLRATGPQKELSHFQELLDQREKGAVFRYVITRANVETLTPDSDRTVRLAVQLVNFQDRMDLPPLREVSIEFANPDASVNVVLEQRASIDAVFDTDGVIVVPEAYRANVAVKTEVSAFGPWSRLKPHSPDLRGHKKFKLAAKEIGPDIVAALKDKTPEEAKAWLASPISLKLGIQPAEGIVFRTKEGDNLDAVSVEVTLTEREGFVLESRDIPIDVLQPHWMLQKRVEIVIERETYTVELLVDPAKRSNFTPENIRLTLDLRAIQPSSGIPDSDDSRLKVANVSVPLRLNVNRDKLPYRIPESRPATEENFVDYRLTIRWKE